MKYGHPSRWQRFEKPLFLLGTVMTVGAVAMAAWSWWTAYEREAAAAVQRGHDLAQLLCAQCHAVADEPTSPRDGAPPFRTLIDRLTIEGVDDMLAESIAIGHDPMPEWTLSSGQISDLLDYMVSLETPSR